MKANEMNALARAPDVTPREAAAYWLMRAQSGEFTAGDRTEFEAWLASDPGHAGVYESVRATWDRAGAAAAAPGILERREAARTKFPALRAAGWRAGAMAAAVLLAAVGGALFWQTHDEAGRIYATEVGERSTVALIDGSKLTLNTASRARVRMDEAQRSVVLERGQALFEVAQDARRPFVVIAGDRRITALGTTFDVRVQSGEVKVTLIEGKVAVGPLHDAQPVGGPASADSRILEPGEQLIAAVSAPPTVRAIDARRAVSWSEGRLVFENEALPAAVAEVNRYSHSTIVLADPRLETLRVSGVFSAGDPAPFLEALAVAFPVTAIPAGNRPEDRTIRLSWRD